MAFDSGYGMSQDISNGAGTAGGASLFAGMLPGLGIGAGVGLLKGLLIDGPAAEKQRKMQAAIAKWSPWTGQKADVSGLQNPGQATASDAMQFAGGGAGLAQNAAKQASDDAFRQQWLQALQNPGTQPGAAGPDPMSYNPVGPVSSGSTYARMLKG